MSSDEYLEDEGLDPSEDGYYEEEEELSPLMAEIREQLMLAPWFIGSAVFHVLIVLLMVFFKTQPPVETQAPVVITTKVVEEEDEEEEEEIVPPEPKENVDPIEEVMTETTNVVSSATTAMTPSVDAPVEISTDVEIDVPTDDIMGDPSEDEVSSPGEESAPAVLGVGGGKFSRHAGVGSGFRGGIGKVGKGLKGMLGRRGGAGGSRGLVLVWLLDQSNSMKDDQEAIAKQASDIQELLSEGGRKKMQSVVVAYEAKPTMLQPPTPDATRIAEVIANVPAADSGSENACKALVYCCAEVLKDFNGWTKVIVLLTDENTSDSRGLAPQEYTGGRKLSWHDFALITLVKSRTRLFVIGKESPFQWGSVRETIILSDGKPWTGSASRGPETPEREIPINIAAANHGSHSYETSGQRLLSGYGVYDLTYLAKGSKGAYYILDESGGAKRPMRLSERRRNPLQVDWEVMENYPPIMCSRSQYRSELARKVGGKEVLELQKRFGQDKGENYHSIRPPSQYHGVRTGWVSRRNTLRGLIRFCKDNIVPDEALEKTDDRRQIANLDCWLILTLAANMIAENYAAALEGYSGPTPDDNMQQLVMTGRPDGPNQEEREAFAARLLELNDACNEVIRRHSNTPWAVCANWVMKSGDHKRYGMPKILEIKPYIPPKRGPAPPPRPTKGRHL